MKSFNFKKKHRKLKENISEVRRNLLILYSSVRRIVPKRVEVGYKTQPKVLILRTSDEIGDAIVCTGLAKKLHDAGYQVNFLAGKSCENLFSHSDFVNKVFLYERKSSPKKMKKEGFDIVIDLSDDVSLKRIILVYKINAKITIGFNKSKYPMYTTSVDFVNKDVHITERHKTVLSLLGLDSSDYKYFLGVSRNDEKIISDVLSPKGLKYVIALNPLTSSKDKDFSQQQVREIIEYIKSNYQGVGIILVGQYEKISKFKNDECIVFHESTISLATAIVKKVDLVITPDTSIVHLARIFNKKMVAVYTNGKLEDTGFFGYKIWLPNYENATVIHVNTPNVSEFGSTEIIEKIQKIIPDELSKGGSR